MSQTFEVGDVVPLTWTVAVAGVATNATVVLTITLPDGTTSTPVVSNPSTGSYTATLSATLNGLHSYRWVASGAVVAADSGTFRVGGQYTTKALVKASLGIEDTDDDDKILAAIETASRYIDRRCNTTFYPVTEARTFEALDGYTVWVDDFQTTTGLVVKTGTNGTYGTTVTASDVVPLPLNAVRKGGSFYRLHIPTGVLPLSNVYATVQVTASWGWSTVPDDVAQACLIKACHLFRRKDSPEGIAGQSEFGVVRISRFEDPDVELLLAPYIPKLVG